MNINNNNSRPIKKQKNFEIFASEPLQVQNDYVVRFATLDDGLINVFEVYKAEDIFFTGNEYLTAWVNMGRVNHQTKTVTLITWLGSEWMRVLLHNEIHGYLPEADYSDLCDTPEAWLHGIALTNMMGCRTFHQRLDFVETTSLFNYQKIVIAFCSENYTRYLDVPAPVCQAISWRTDDRESCLSFNKDKFPMFTVKSELDYPIQAALLRRAILSEFHKQDTIVDFLINLLGYLFGKKAVLRDVKDEIVNIMLPIAKVACSMGWDFVADSIKDMFWEKTVLMRTNLDTFSHKGEKLAEMKCDDFLEWMGNSEDVNEKRGFFFLENKKMEKKYEANDSYDLVNLYNFPLRLCTELEGSDIDWDNLISAAHDEDRELDRLEISMADQFCSNFSPYYSERTYRVLEFFLPYTTNVNKIKTTLATLCAMYWDNNLTESEMAIADTENDPSVPSEDDLSEE